MVPSAHHPALFLIQDGIFSTGLLPSDAKIGTSIYK